MKKRILSFRTKAEAILVASFLICLSVISVMSVTRTITDTSDTVYTYITNNNGNYWTATGANIQVAIDDVNGSSDGGGTVWLPKKNYTVTDTIHIPYNISLYPNGARVIPDGDFDVFRMYKRSTLENVIIDISGVATYSNTSAAIRFYNPPALGEYANEEGWDTPTNRIVRDVSVWSSAEGRGIGLLLNPDHDYDAFAFNYVEHFYGFQLNTTIKLLVDYTGTFGTYINYNTFKDVKGAACAYNIWLREDEENEISMNTFNGIIYEAEDYGPSEHYPIFIEGQCQNNMFLGCGFMDWITWGDTTDYIYIHNLRGDDNTYGNYFTGSSLSQSYITDENSVGNNSYFGTNTTIRALTLSTSKATGHGLNPGYSGSGGLTHYRKTTGNPYTYWYGYVTADADRYGAFVVDSAGDWNFISEVGHIVLDPIVATKYVGINETTPTAELEIEGTGKITVDWTVDSDERIKQVIDLLPENAVRKFCENVSIYRYYKIENWEDENGNRIFGDVTNSESLGIVAQELWNTTNELFGEQYADLLVVKGNETELWTIRYSMVGLIFDRWCQILNNDIKDLEQRIADIEELLGI